MYPVNPFNPYQNNPSYLQQHQTANPNQIIKVNGMNGAQAYQMPPNSQVLLLDETQPILWLKQTDGAGYPSLTAYDIKPHQEQQQPDIKSLEDRISKIEEAIKREPYTAGNSRKKPDDAASKTNGAADKILQ